MDRSIAQLKLGELLVSYKIESGGDSLIVGCDGDAVPSAGL